MRHVLLGIAVLALISTAAAAEDKATPFFGENLMVTMPDTWHQVYDANKDVMHITEFVPKGQAADNWRQMITVQVFHGIQNVDPQAYIEKMNSMARQQAIGEIMEFKVLDMPGGEKYPSAGVMWVGGHFKSTGKGETTLMRVIQGKDSLYVVQMAWRQPAFTSLDQMIAKPKDIDQGIEFLKSVFIADSREKPEAK